MVGGQRETEWAGYKMVKFLIRKYYSTGINERMGEDGQSVLHIHFNINLQFNLPFIRIAVCAALS